MKLTPQGQDWMEINIHLFKTYKRATKTHYRSTQAFEEDAQSTNEIRGPKEDF